MLSALVSRIIVVLFGVLHPAYKSYKALKQKDTKEHVRCMMHWVVFACFYAFEISTDYFLSWLPMYYEMKMVFVIWLICPMTCGSSILYRKIIHPLLEKNEPDIDAALSKAQEQGYVALASFGAKGLNLAASTVVSTVIKGQYLLSNQMQRRSYSMSDLSMGHTDLSNNMMMQSQMANIHSTMNVPLMHDTVTATTLTSTTTAGEVAAPRSMAEVRRRGRSHATLRPASELYEVREEHSGYLDDSIGRTLTYAEAQIMTRTTQRNQRKRQVQSKRNQDNPEERV